MKPSPTLLTLLFSFVVPIAISAATATQNAAPAFELPRLRSKDAPGNPNRMPKAKATVDELSTRGRTGAVRARKQDIDYLALDGGRHWSAPLHGAPRDTTFVSFFVYASVGTVIDVGGAKLMIRPGEKPDYAQVQVGTPGQKGTQWRPFGGPIRFEKHNGKLLAPMPVLTVRLDPAAKEWDLFVANRLAMAGLRLADGPKDAPASSTSAPGRMASGSAD